MVPKVLGIDIGGTRIRAATSGPDGKIIEVARMATEAQKGPQQAIERMIELGRQVLSASKIAKPTVVGVGAGGPLDGDTGVLINPPNLPGWINTPLKQILEDAYGVPVFVDNDANAAALAEHRFGAGVGVRDMVYITVSTGIGGGIIANGQLLHGLRTSAGEIGHHTILPNGPLCGCGARGCLEALASGTAIARRAREALASGKKSIMISLAGGDLASITSEIVVEALRRGDDVACAIWDATIDYLATGIGNVIVTLAPEMVVIGGGVSEVGDLLFQPLRQKLRERVCIVPIDRIQIVRAKLGVDVGVVGALAVGIDHLSGKQG